MTRHEMKLYGAWAVLSIAVITGVRIGLELLGARDELIALVVVGLFVLTMFLMGFVPEDSPPDKR